MTQFQQQPYPHEQGQQQPYPYPPDTAYQPGPPPKPPKKSRKKLWLILGGILAALIFLSAIASLAGGGKSSTTTTNSSSSASQPTVTVAPTQPVQPTPKPKTWTVTQTFSGSGIKETQTFAISDDIKIKWTGNPSSFYGGQYNLIVSIYQQPKELVDLPINTIVKAGNTSGETEVHGNGGTVYLEVNSEGDWTIQVLELK